MNLVHQVQDQQKMRNCHRKVQAWWPNRRTRHNEGGGTRNGRRKKQHDVMLVSPWQISIYVKPYLWSWYMKSVVYHALRTVSGNAYVKCRLWNRVVLILCPCHFALNMISHTLLLIRVQFDILLLGIHSDDSIMAWQPCWQDPEGLDVIKTIIKKLILNWMNPFWTERAFSAVLWLARENQQHSRSWFLCSWLAFGV